MLSVRTGVAAAAASLLLLVLFAPAAYARDLRPGEEDFFADMDTGVSRLEAEARAAAEQDEMEGRGYSWGKLGKSYDAKKSEAGKPKTCKAEINLLGLSSAKAQLKDSEGALLHTWYSQKDEITMRIAQDKSYTLTVEVEGSKTDIDLACKDGKKDVRIANLVCSLSTRFTGMQGRVGTWGSFVSGLVSKFTKTKIGAATVQVLRAKGIKWNLPASGKWSKKTHVVEHDTDCEQDEQEEPDVTSELTVDFNGVSGVSVNLKALELKSGKDESDDDDDFDDYDIGDIEYGTDEQVDSVDDVWRLFVVAGKYQVEATKGDMTVVRKVTCKDGCKVDDLTAVMNLKYAGVSGVTVSVKDAAGNEHGAAVASTGSSSFTVLRGQYDVTLTGPAGITVTETLDCSTGECELSDTTAALTIDFAGVHGVDVEVRNTANSQLVASATSQDNVFVAEVMQHGAYTVTVTKDGVSKSAAVACLSGTCTAAGFASKVSIAFANIDNVDVSAVSTGTSNVAASVSNADGGARFTVLGQALDITLTRGGHTYTASNVDCSSDCSVADVGITMTVRATGLAGATGSIKVGATEVAAASIPSTGVWRVTLLPGTYTQSVTWNSMTWTSGSIACTSAGSDCSTDDASSQITVNSFGLTGADISIGSVASETGHDGVLTMRVLRGQTYSVSVSKAGASVTGDVTCSSGDCSLDNVTTTLRLAFPGLSGVDVTATPTSGSGAMSSVTGANGDAALTVLRGTTYTVELTHNGVTKTLSNVSASSAATALVGQVGRLTVLFAGETGVSVEIRSGSDVVASATGQANAYTAALLCGTYDVYVNGVLKGSPTVPCASATDVGADADDLSSTTFNAVTDADSITFSGLTGIENLAIDCSHQTAVDRFRRNMGDAAASFAINQTLAGTWDRTISQGAASISDTFTTTAGAPYTEDLSSKFATLTVNTGGVLDGLTVAVRTAAGGLVLDAEDVSGSHAMVVLKGTYDVTVSDGAESVTITGMNCSSGTCSVAADDLVCTVTVQHPNVAVTRVSLLQNGVALDKVAGVSTDSSSFVALHGTYSLRVADDAAVIAKDITCAAATLTVSDLVSTLTMTHTGINDADVSISVADGLVHRANAGSGSTAVPVLRDSAYSCQVTMPGVVTTTALDCSGATCGADVGATLSTAFTGLTGVRVSTAVSGGDGTLVRALDADSSAALNLLRAVYDVTLSLTADSQGGVSRTWSNVDCTSGSCSLSASDVVSTITANFDGLSPATVAFQASGSGDHVAALAEAVTSGSVTRSVLATDGYSVSVEWMGITVSQSGLDVSASPVSLDFAATLEIQFPWRDLVHVAVIDTLTDSMVATVYNASTTTTVTVLAGREYEIQLSGPGFPLPETRTVAAWTGHAVSEPPMDKEMAALEALYNTCGGASWTRSDNWEFVRGTRVCDTATTTNWHGIHCRDWVVKEVELEWNNIVCSKLPDKLVDLEFLQVLYLEGNEVRAVNDNMDQMRNLKRLRMSYNGMTGDLPMQVTALGNSLQYLELHGNQLTGELTEDFNNLVHLKALKLQHNTLSGEIPFLGNMTELQTLQLNHNMFTGEMPQWIDELVNLKMLWLQENNLNGMLPEGLGYFRHIDVVDVSNNDLEGGIPSLRLLTSMNDLKTDGNPRMTESAECSDNADGTTSCSSVGSTDAESSAAAIVPGMLAVAAVATAVFAM